MYDPETTFQPMIDEITESIATMRELNQIDDKLKYSDHIQRLSSTFENMMSTVTMMMSEDMMDGMDDDEFDDFEDEF